MPLNSKAMFAGQLILKFFNSILDHLNPAIAADADKMVMVMFVMPAFKAGHSVTEIKGLSYTALGKQLDGPVNSRRAD